MLPTSTSDSTPATSPCVIALSRLRNSFRFCIVPPTAPIEHMLPMRSSGNVQSVQMRGREPPAAERGGARGRVRRRLAAERAGRGVGRHAGGPCTNQDQRQRHRDHQDAEQLQRRRASRSALVERVRDQRHQRAADADAEIGEAHRPAAAGVEPASRAAPGSGSGPPQHVAERVAQVERVEHRQRRRIAPSPIGARPASRMPTIISRREPKRSTNQPAKNPNSGPIDQLRVGVARGHLGPRPAELLDHEVVEERQPVEGEADDREQRHERRHRRQRLAARPFGAHAGVPSLIALSRAASGMRLVERVEREAARDQAVARAVVQSLKVRQMAPRVSGLPARTSAGSAG